MRKTRSSGQGSLFKDPEYKLKIGMTINADIITRKKDGVLIIPREAVFNKENKSVVFLVKGSQGKRSPDRDRIKRFFKC